MSLGLRISQLNDSQREIEGWRALPGGVFEIDDYDLKPPFASFLPGIAGETGAPLWCMYVNRGQAVCSFGYQDKDHSVAEFLSANWAYQLAGLYGFRTFLVEKAGSFYEPFAEHCTDRTSRNRCLCIQHNAVTVIEECASEQWRVVVDYTSISGSPVPALCRTVRVTNLANKPRSIRLADGLPVVVPAGVSDFAMKKLRYIIEALVRVRLHESGVALYAPPSTIDDSAQVADMKEASFYGAWQERDEELRSLPLAVDTQAFFGQGRGLFRPGPFVNDTFDLDTQLTVNRLPSAFALSENTFAPGETLTFVAYSGFATDEALLDSWLHEYAVPGAWRRIQKEAGNLAIRVTEPAMANTASVKLNGYTRQNFLDNLLRGGEPHLFPSRQGPRPVHVYTRRHGDMERDYNSFEVPPHPYSEGSGNFRDILQNRRHETWFYPGIKHLDLVAFINLLQPDGYNPLSLGGYRWQMPEDLDAGELCLIGDHAAREEFARLVQRGFSPGELSLWMIRHGADSGDQQRWLHDFLRQCNTYYQADGDHDGYWCDHWTYLTDMVEAYEGIYPDGMATLFQHSATWFEPKMSVLPRSQRYQWHNGYPRQYGALEPRDHMDRKEPWPESSVAGKLLTLAAVKAVSLDPEGRGLEMEAGRPCWNDAMNGLPGLFGSSTCETAELVRLVRLLNRHLESFGEVILPGPAAYLVRAVAALLRKAESYPWEEAANLRESYRWHAYHQREVETETVDASVLEQLLASIERLGHLGLESARTEAGSPLIHTYFRRGGGETETEKRDVAAPDPRRLPPTPLPLFLEGQVHLMRLARDQKTAREIYTAVKFSPLFDRELRMFLLNENLTGCPKEIGRAHNFTRGSFENESVWLHMSYKFLVEMLRHGLYDEFFDDAQTMLVPFMAPQCYGRSIFENSSFIAASCCPDPAARGRGFVARLTGSTAEFIHIWLMLTVGTPQPFRLSNGELQFQLLPALPASWFASEPRTVFWQGGEESLPANTMACALLGNILLVYHNPDEKDSWGPNGVMPRAMALDGGDWVGSGVLSGKQAQAIRERRIRRLDVMLR